MSEENTQEPVADAVCGTAESGTSNEAVVYIGPNKLSEGLKTYTVYKEEPADMIGTLKKSYPQIGRLFVGVGNLNGAMAAVTSKGTPLFIAYAEALAEPKKEGNE